MKAGTISSMTGFGRGEAVKHGIKVTVEIGSVNRKQFECQFSLPRELGVLESDLYRLVQAQVQRGYLKGTLHVAADSGTTAPDLRIDMELAKGWLRELRQAGGALGLNDDLALSDLFELPGIITSTTATYLAEPRKLLPLAKEAAQEAIEGLLAMRQREGRALARELKQRRRRLVTLCNRIVRRAPRVPLAYREMLMTRLKRHAIEEPELASDALVRELAIFAERCDITEETTRLTSHLAQAERLLTGYGPVGRELDFLCQEMLREINTIGSKANDAAIATLVITFKAQLEMLREQIQNVE